MAVDFAAEQSFEQASKRLHLHHRVNLSASCIRKITYHHAESIAIGQQAQGCQGCLPGQASESLILEMDGSMVPIVEHANKHCGSGRREKHCKWKEFRLCAAQSKGQCQVHYGVSATDVDQAGYCWAKAARDAGWAINSQLHAVVDGAEWIYKQWQHNFSCKGRYLVDFYHVCEYLAAAQPVAATHKKWLEVRKNRLKTNHPERVLSALSPYLENEKVAQSDAPVRAAYRYLQNRIDQLDYASAIAQDLPIGSGMIESAHKHVLQKRLKLAGAWWCMQNAQSMAQLRVCRANNQEDQYWNNLLLAA